MDVKINKESSDYQEQLNETTNSENNLKLDKESSCNPGKGRFIQILIIIMRVLNLLTSLSAIYTTMAIDIYVSLGFYCGGYDYMTRSRNVGTENVYVKYPFRFEGQPIKVPISCQNYSQHETHRLYQADFSDITLLYVGIGILSGGYSVISLLIHLCACTKIGNRILTIDKWVMSFLTITWLVGTTVWLVNIIDIKQYTSEEYLLRGIAFCDQDNSYRGQCFKSYWGNFTLFDFSMGSGFVGVLLWIVSIVLVNWRKGILRQPITNQGNSSTLNCLSRFLQQNFRKISEQDYNGFNLIKITLISFYSLGIIATISLAGVSLANVRGYNYSSQIVVIVFGLIYEIILSVVAVYGVLKEYLNFMIAMIVMNVICIVVNGFIFSWISSILVSFTTVLTAIYAFMIFHKNMKTDLNSKQILESFIEK